MIASLILNNFAQASRATSFNELWHRLTNDQLFELRRIFHSINGRDLDPFFTNATPEDWSGMTSLIGTLGSSVAKLNSRLSGLDWDRGKEIYAALEDLQCEAKLRSQECSVVMEYLTGIVKDYLVLGEDDESNDSWLVEIKALPLPPVLDESAYDIFISYKTANYAAQAARLYEGLTALGYRVWFDKQVLDKMQNRPEKFEKEHLISILNNAIRHSRCTVIFEAMMHAVALPPGYSEEQSLAERTTMKGLGGSLLAWDWQILEIQSTQRGIAIYQNTVTAFRNQDGKTVWSKSFEYNGDQQLLESIKVALGLFESASSE